MAKKLKQAVDAILKKMSHEKVSDASRADSERLDELARLIPALIDERDAILNRGREKRLADANKRFAGRLIRTNSECSTCESCTTIIFVEQVVAAWSDGSFRCVGPTLVIRKNNSLVAPLNPPETLEFRFYESETSTVRDATIISDAETKSFSGLAEQMVAGMAKDFIKKVKCIKSKR